MQLFKGQFHLSPLQTFECAKKTDTRFLQFISLLQRIPECVVLVHELAIFIDNVGYGLLILTPYYVN